MLSRYLHNIFALPVLLVVCSGCGQGAALNRVLQSAGSNRVELVSVLDHYRSVDPNPDKLRAAEFLIENMPAHYSYAGKEVYQYYDYAAQILADTTLTPEQQRDSLLDITDLNT